MDNKIYKRKDSLIQDTSPGEMILKTNERDSNVNADGIIELGLKQFRDNTITFAMRMNQDLLNHVKQKARERAAELKQDVTYQMIISEAVAEKYPDYNNEK